MDIRLVTSLTTDDEDQFAPVVLRAITELFEKTSVAYAVRIETVSGKVMQRSGPDLDLMEAPSAVPGRRRDTSQR